VTQFRTRDSTVYPIYTAKTLNFSQKESSEIISAISETDKTSIEKGWAFTGTLSNPKLIKSFTGHEHTLKDLENAFNDRIIGTIHTHPPSSEFDASEASFGDYFISARNRAPYLGIAYSNHGTPAIRMYKLNSNIVKHQQDIDSYAAYLNWERGIVKARPQTYNWAKIQAIVEKLEKTLPTVYTDIGDFKLK
jgi:hypothetical protein